MKTKRVLLVEGQIEGHSTATYSLDRGLVSIAGSSQSRVATQYLLRPVALAR